MGAPPEPAPGRSARRAELERKQQSRRPSRLGTRAGTAAKPDYPLEHDAGFPGLLKRVWHEAAGAPDPVAAARVLLTLGGHVPADVQLRALRPAEEAGLAVLFGETWRDGWAGAYGTDAEPTVLPFGRPAAFLGELALTTSGRVVLRAPAQEPLDVRNELVGGVIRVPWSAAAVGGYRRELDRARRRSAAELADCRRWLADAGAVGRDELLEQLKEAALRTAPFILYQDGRQYTNFRDRNTLTGKTLWPGHPDCSLTALQGVPLELWPDGDAVAVVCLALLVRSAGYARIEEANGTQLSLGHVGYLLERTRHAYNAVPGGDQVPPADAPTVAQLYRLATALRTRRTGIAPRVRLYREIHGTLMHKIERIAGPLAAPARQREEALCRRLRDRLPVTGGTLAELAAALADAPGWLAEPHGGFGTGLESLVHATASAAAEAFEADFAMSRGMRSLPRLVRALRAQDWDEIVKWEIAEYFCCVVPAPGARELFDGSAAHLADTAWAISARMQYNSWHFIAGNLPKLPQVRARDYFVPPTIPDVAFNSDQHHRGHVSARVRYSIRSPQAVRVLDRTFAGFVDLRLLRCAGRPFDEQDLLAAHQASGFIAHATGLAADLVAGGAELEVTAFDPAWHWAAIAGESP